MLEITLYLLLVISWMTLLPKLEMILAASIWMCYVSSNICLN